MDLTPAAAKLYSYNRWSPFKLASFPEPKVIQKTDGLQIIVAHYFPLIV